jgi:hypothetical protein
MSEGIGTHGSNDEKIRPETLGTLFSGMEAKIIPAEGGGDPLPPGEQGELCMRGPNIIQGYFENPEATKEALVDGFFHTGDIGQMDSDGYFIIVDRKKELIKVSWLLALSIARNVRDTFFFLSSTRGYRSAPPSWKRYCFLIRLSSTPALSRFRRRIPQTVNTRGL